jgi:hypothetical protein
MIHLRDAIGFRLRELESELRSAAPENAKGIAEQIDVVKELLAKAAKLIARRAIVE